MSRTVPKPEIVTVRVPFRIVKRGGRKEIRLPEGLPQQRRADSTLIKALARAFRWKKMLESRECVSVTEIATREDLSLPYISRVLRLSLLAPDIVEAIIKGQQPPALMLADLYHEVPADWKIQRARWLVDRDDASAA